MYKVTKKIILSKTEWRRAKSVGIKRPLSILYLTICNLFFAAASPAASAVASADASVAISAAAGVAASAY